MTDDWQKKEEDEERQRTAQALGFRSVEDAARQLGYQAGLKHDQAHPQKSYRLSVQTVAQLLAEELRLYQEVRPAFVEAYGEGCQVSRAKKRNTYTPAIFDVRIEREEENDAWLISRLDYNDQDQLVWVPVERETRYQCLLDNLELGEYRLVHSDGPFAYYRVPPEE